MLEKLALRKFLKIIKKNIFSSVPFKILELSNPPSYKNSKTDSTENISFVCFENFKIGWRASVVESHFNKVAKTVGFCNSAQKSKKCMVCSEMCSSRNFEKSPFNKSCRLTVESLNATKNKLLVNFLKGVLKFIENFQEMISNDFPYQKFQTCKLLPSALCVFKLLR